MGSSEKTGFGKQRLVSLVLPVYNEQPSLAMLHQRISDAVAPLGDDYEFVFVDDGSSDGSFDELCRLNRLDPRVRVVRFRRNFGKSAAYSAGFEHARGAVVITLDTDLQDDPGEIAEFIDKIDEGFDMVAGWKFEGKGSLEKSLPSRFFNWVVRKVTGIPLHDFNCPFKAYRSEVLDEIEVYGELHRYIPVLASARGFTLSEVKIKNLPRQHGTSHYGLERYVRGMLDLLTVVFITRFARRPMHLLALGGLGAVGLGLGTVAFFVVGHILYTFNVLTDPSWIIHDRPALTLGILLVIVGFQFLASGLLAELIVRGHARRGRDRGFSVSEVVDTPDAPAKRPPADEDERLPADEEEPRPVGEVERR